VGEEEIRKVLECEEEEELKNGRVPRLRDSMHSNEDFILPWSFRVTFIIFMVRPVWD
jgi:hypothetical protein